MDLIDGVMGVTDEVMDVVDLIEAILVMNVIEALDVTDDMEAIQVLDMMDALFVRRCCVFMHSVVGSTRIPYF